MTTSRVWFVLIQLTEVPHSIARETTFALDKRASRRFSSITAHPSGTGLERRFSDPDWNVNHPSRRGSETWAGILRVMLGFDRNLPRMELGFWVSREGTVSQTFQARPPASLITRNVIRLNLEKT